MKTLTENEKLVLKALVKNAQSEGDNGVEYCMDSVASELEKSIHSITGTCSSLQDKGYIECWGGDYYFDGKVNEEAIKWYNNNF